MTTDKTAARTLDHLYGIATLPAGKFIGLGNRNIKRDRHHAMRSERPG